MGGELALRSTKRKEGKMSLQSNMKREACSNSSEELRRLAIEWLAATQDVDSLIEVAKCCRFTDTQILAMNKLYQQWGTVPKVRKLMIELKSSSNPAVAKTALSLLGRAVRLG